MKKEIQFYLPVAKAIEALVHPYAEVVLHDLEQQKIVALLNTFSKRKVGDDSLLEKEAHLKKYPDYFEPYYKTNWDGRKIKSTSITIRDNKGKAVGLLCINLDISKFEELQHILASFTHIEMDKTPPRELFSEDWREKISRFVQSYLSENNMNLKTIPKEAKRQLVHHLYQEGAFRAKHAATYVADVLGISRATVYKYLKEFN